jgi:hypothetical protein
MLLVHDNICVGCPMQNNKIVNNVLFSRGKSQLTISAQTNFEDIDKFGEFNGNYYNRPFGDNFSMNSVQRSSGTILNQIFGLQNWQQTYRLDKNSKNFPIIVPPYTIAKKLSENQLGNGKFDQNIKGLYVKALDGNSSVEWGASGPLDGGCLKWSYTSISNKYNKSYLVFDAGEVKSGQQYVLRFSSRGTANNQIIGAYLRRSNAPYDNISETNYFQVGSNRNEHIILLTPSVTEKTTSIGFQLQGGDGTVWIDNMELYKADVIMTNADEYMYFDFNPTKSNKKVNLKKTYVDTKNKSYSNYVIIPPYSSIILIKTSASSDEEKTSLPLGHSFDSKIQKGKNPFVVYPNPALNFINVVLNDESKTDILIEIINTLGVTVSRNEFDKNSLKHNYTLDISHLKVGTYFIRVKVNQAIYSEKFIKSF